MKPMFFAALLPLALPLPAVAGLLDPVVENGAPMGLNCRIAQRCVAQDCTGAFGTRALVAMPTRSTRFSAEDGAQMQASAALMMRDGRGVMQPVAYAPAPDLAAWRADASAPRQMLTDPADGSADALWLYDTSDGADAPLLVEKLVCEAEAAQ